MLLLLASAFASPPMVIRITDETTELKAPVVATVTSGDETTDVTLTDDGQPPDVNAKDGRWAAKVDLEGQKVSISLSVAGKAMGTSTVEFEVSDGPRDVDLKIDGGSLVAVGSVPMPDQDGPNGGGGGEAGPAPDGGPAAGGADGAAGAGGTPPPPPLGDGVAAPGAAAGGGPGTGGGNAAASGVSFGPTRKQQSGLAFIAFGVGIFVMLGVAWLWMRGRGGGGARAARPKDLVSVPEPGLFDAALPSVSDGLSVWFVGEPEGFVPPLLTHLAEHHRVLVVGRAAVQVAPVRGGPVYRLVGIKPSAIVAAAEALLDVPGQPLVVLAVLDATDHPLVRELRDALPADVGGLVILPEVGDVPVPSVRVTPGRVGWTLRYGEVGVDVVERERGLERAGT